MQLGKVPALERGCVHKFWGRNKLDDHFLFSRGCKYASEPKLWNDNWDCSACPPTLHGIPMISAGSTCSQDLHHHKNYVFFLDQSVHFQPPLKVSVYRQMREVAHAERGVQNVQVVQTSSENTFKLSPSASLPESDQYHHPRIPENDCKMCNFCNKKWEKTK